MGALDRELLDALLEAYSEGAFPMADPATGRLDFLIPRRRAIIPLAPEPGFHVPRRLQRTVRQGRFTITSDEAFSDVARACAAPRDPTPRSKSVSAETWIDERILHFYDVLFAHGQAHSVEAWLAPGVPEPSAPETMPAPAPDRGAAASPVLVGGVLGVSIGGFFGAETMFTRPDLGGTDAGKVCLVHLVRHLEAQGFTLLDAQIANPHTAQFGVVEISHGAYIKRLRRAIGQPASWGKFQDGQARPPGVGRLDQGKRT